MSDEERTPEIDEDHTSEISMQNPFFRATESDRYARQEQIRQYEATLISKVDSNLVDEWEKLHAVV